MYLFVIDNIVGGINYFIPWSDSVCARLLMGNKITFHQTLATIILLACGYVHENETIMFIFNSVKKRGDANFALRKEKLIVFSNLSLRGSNLMGTLCDEYVVILVILLFSYRIYHNPMSFFNFYSKPTTTSFHFHTILNTSSVLLISVQVVTNYHYFEIMPVCNIFL